MSFSLDIGKIMEGVTITTPHNTTILEEAVAAISAINNAPILEPAELAIILRHPLTGTGTDEKGEY